MKRVRDVRYTKDDLIRHMVGKRENFVANVATIANECRRRGIIFIPATQQSKSFLIDRDKIRGTSYQDERQQVLQSLAKDGTITHLELDFLTHAAMMDTLVTWVHSQGLPLADVIAAMNGRRDCLVSWVHLSPEGNRIVARTFEASILSRLEENNAAGITQHAAAASPTASPSSPPAPLQNHN
ncbi:MAG TPA: hypothetical protein VFH88_15465, partial [Candidatus Krumholzibacteria bacterium]|nr:hypothetical protein [Candidatus Krumholzibacteria bacterium]